jgi:gluconate kinase
VNTAMTGNRSPVTEQFMTYSGHRMDLPKKICKLRLFHYEYSIIYCSERLNREYRESVKNNRTITKIIHLKAPHQHSKFSWDLAVE